MLVVRARLSTTLPLRSPLLRDLFGEESPPRAEPLGALVVSAGERSRFDLLAPEPPLDPVAVVESPPR